MTKPLAFIIEDDKKLAHIFSLALQAAEFEVEVIQDGATALTRIAALSPALVVLDLHLPYVSGKDILQHIQADDRLTHTKVIVVSADLFRAESLQAEVDAVLVKPIGFRRLRDVAARLRPT